MLTRDGGQLRRHGIVVRRASPSASIYSRSACSLRAPGFRRGGRRARGLLARVGRDGEEPRVLSRMMISRHCPEAFVTTQGSPTWARNGADRSSPIMMLRDRLPSPSRANTRMWRALIVDKMLDGHGFRHRFQRLLLRAGPHSPDGRHRRAGRRCPRSFRPRPGARGIPQTLLRIARRRCRSRRARRQRKKTDSTSPNAASMACSGAI